jgi:hypothetical protein
MLDIKKIQFTEKDVTMNKKLATKDFKDWYCENYPTVIKVMDAAMDFFKNPLAKGIIWLAEQAITVVAKAICPKKK